MFDSYESFHISGGLDTEVRPLGYVDPLAWGQPLPVVLPGCVEPLQSCDPYSLGRHRLLGRLGQGGMGVVYLADGPLGRIAVKTIHSHLTDNPAFHARFQHEVQACFRVRGPHTAELLDFDVTGPTPWLATEFIEAPDLEQLIKREGQLSFGAQFELALGLADALAVLHASGIIHRDLKPSNVLCSATGPRVIDFGIAAAVDDAGLTGTGSFIGTTAWMSPERLEGRTTNAADIYAWGALMAYAASGRPLFDDATPLQMMMIVANGCPHVDYDAIDPRLRDAVAAALARSPEFRPTAQQLRDALARERIEVPPAPYLEPVRPTIHDNWAGRPSQFPWVDPFAKTQTAPQVDTPTFRPDGLGKPELAGLAGATCLVSALLPSFLNGAISSYGVHVHEFGQGAQGIIAFPVGLTFLAAALLVTRARGPFRRTRRAARVGAAMAFGAAAVFLVNATSTADVAARIAAHPPLLAAAFVAAAVAAVTTLVSRRRGRRVTVR
jgi:hypothetical protein